MSVSVTVFANAAQQGAGGGGFDEEITVGSTVYCVDGTSDNFLIYGYNVGNFDFHNDSSYGTITGTTYTDGGSNSRTVAAVWWTENGSGSCASSGDVLGLSLQGTSIPNTDNTFIQMEYEDNFGSIQTYTRASATYTASSNGGTHWRWSSPTGTPPVSGVRTIRLTI